MLKITMIRHGKTEGSGLGRYVGVTEEHLLEKEKEMLKTLVFPKVEAVYISPMIRCRETAEILFDYLEPVVVEELAECDFGYLEGKTYQELLGDPKYKDWIGSGEITSFPGGENRQEFQARSIRGFERVVEDAMRKNLTHIGIVAHGGNIMSILGAYGFPVQPYQKWLVDNAEGYRIRLQPKTFLSNENREIIVDGKIDRPAV